MRGRYSTWIPDASPGVRGRIEATGFGCVDLELIAEVVTDTVGAAQVEDVLWNNAARFYLDAS